MRRYGGGILYAALPLHMQRGCFRIRTHDQQVTKAQLYRCTRARPRKNITSNKKKTTPCGDCIIGIMSSNLFFNSLKSANFRNQQIKKSKIANPVDETTKNHRKPTQTHLTPGNSSPIASCLAKSPV